MLEVFNGTMEEAQKAGAKYFANGTPCKHGHLNPPRHAQKGHCMECAKERKRVKERTRKDWSKELEGITDQKARNRLYMKAYRSNPKHAAAVMWRAAKARAEEKGLEFTIELEDIVIPEFCPVLGIKLQPGKATRWEAPSLDRFDSTKGYTKDNIRVISHRANFLKNDATLEEMEALLRYMRG